MMIFYMPKSKVRKNKKEMFREETGRPVKANKEKNSIEKQIARYEYKLSRVDYWANERKRKYKEKIKNLKNKVSS